MILRLLACLLLLVEPGGVRRDIDGDTFTLYTVGVPAEERVRVLHVNTPERGEPGYLEAKYYTTLWLASGPFEMEACSRDSFGRLLAVVHRGSDTLSVDLIRDGLGKPYR